MIPAYGGIRKASFLRLDVGAGVSRETLSRALPTHFAYLLFDPFFPVLDTLGSVHKAIIR